MRRVFLTIMILAALVLTAPAAASDTATGRPYPTVQALEQAEMPIADAVVLAQRFRGVGTIPPVPDAPAALTAGLERDFWVTNLAAGRTFEITATLRAVGESIYMWVENGATVRDDDLRALAAGFDANVYAQVRELWGSENSPGIDGDPRVHALFARDLGPGVAAYYARRHSFPTTVIPGSNEQEMFIVNLAVTGTSIATSRIEGTLAHEFQHMIRDNIDTNEDSWLDEGTSVFTEFYLGYTESAWMLRAFLNAPDTQLNTWSIGGSTGPHYGGVALLLGYLYDRYGLEAMQTLSADPANGLIALDHTLAAVGGPDFDTFFAQWVVANLTQAAHGPLALPQPVVKDAVVDALPYSVQATLPQYATDYYTITDLNGAESLEIRLEAPPTVALVPYPESGGSWVWYSNRGDVSNPRLTRAFDLSGVEAATLEFRAWYAIEDGWDYAYVTASSDGGATWAVLPASGTTTFDPHGNAYGPGFTGDSGGWRDVRVDLGAYAGETVLLRFEMITDDAVNRPGIVIDDVRIDAIDYVEDFETGGGGWQAEGWLRIDNVLPQQVWVQAVQFADDGFEVTRWRGPVDVAWSLPLAEGAESVVIAVSPFAPVTTVPTSYTLSASKR